MPARRMRGGPVSERTFRAVVAGVLVGALALAAVVVFVGLSSPSASPVPTAARTATARPPLIATATPTPTPGHVFGDVGVTPVGSVPRGGASSATLVLRFVEPSIDAIPAAVGSLTVTLADSGGSGSTLAFSGTPALDAPGSLGTKAGLIAGNILLISIRGSDSLNIEPITITGLGIRATPDAALGPITATLGDFSGSLVGGVTNAVLLSPGTVIAGP
jgi:hypothetical protein